MTHFSRVTVLRAQRSGTHRLAARSLPLLAMVGGLLVLGQLFVAPRAALAEDPAAASTKYLLRYKFEPGEVIRWEVQHQAVVRTTVQDNTQTAETNSVSVKAWKVNKVDPDGSVTLVHSVESIDMWQKMSNRQEVRYNSKTDTEVPNGFQDAAKNVGIPLSTLTLDATGKTLKRVDHAEQKQQQAEHLTTPLPAEPIAIGEEWQVPYETMATSRDGQTRRIEMRHRLKLEDVKGTLATIRIETAILTPIGDDATLEAQLIQGFVSGTIRFDIQAGRIISQKNDLDKHIVGFQGNASSLHYLTRFTERLMSPAAETAQHGPQPLGPQPPK